MHQPCVIGRVHLASKLTGYRVTQDRQTLVRLLQPLLDQLSRYDDSVLKPSHDTAALQGLVRRVRERLLA